MNTAQMRGILAGRGFSWHENEGSSYYVKVMPWSSERIVLWNQFRSEATVGQLGTITHVCFQQMADDRWSTDNRTVTWPTFEELLRAIQDGAYQLCEHPNEILPHLKPPLPPQRGEMWVNL